MQQISPRPRVRSLIESENRYTIKDEEYLGLVVSLTEDEKSDSREAKDSSNHVY